MLIDRILNEGFSYFGIDDNKRCRFSDGSQEHSRWEGTFKSSQRFSIDHIAEYSREHPDFDVRTIPDLKPSFPNTWFEYQSNSLFPDSSDKEPDKVGVQILSSIDEKTLITRCHSAIYWGFKSRVTALCPMFGEFQISSEGRLIKNSFSGYYVSVVRDEDRDTLNRHFVDCIKPCFLEIAVYNGLRLED